MGRRGDGLLTEPGSSVWPARVPSIALSFLLFAMADNVWAQNDVFGDPLPPGVLARRGSVRLDCRIPLARLSSPRMGSRYRCQRPPRTRAYGSSIQIEDKCALIPRNQVVWRIVERTRCPALDWIACRC